MEIVRTKDTGTLQYDIYFNDDQSEAIVYERYSDSGASSNTVRTLAKWGRQSLRRDPSPTNSLVSRAQSSERHWQAVRSVSSLDSCQCRHRSPAWAAAP